MCICMCTVTLITIAKCGNNLSVSRWIKDKENMVFIYNKILLSFNKEGNPATSDNMDKPGGHYSQRNKPEKEKYCMGLLICGIKKKKVQFIGTESRMVIARGCKEGKRREIDKRVQKCTSFQ